MSVSSDTKKCDPKTWGKGRIGFATCACGWNAGVNNSRRYANLLARLHRAKS